MEAAEPHASESSASPIGADAPASKPGAATGARKRKAPVATARKPRKQQAQETIQIPVYYGQRAEFYCVKGGDLVDCSYISPRVKDCAHVIGQLLLCNRCRWWIYSSGSSSCFGSIQKHKISPLRGSSNNAKLTCSTTSNLTGIWSTALGTHVTFKLTSAGVPLPIN
ncbi:uncharacterized protein [Triticum aestivum]|uniref:uncharacterized protein n=1 Tax=Triticum aestivum TaxID=4565 RepID=UPI00098BA7D4|nr:uncharacterized protein LOC109779249 [Aegilops tauschii subsp. strangulata]XP_044330747.1 uncharacterized protein LOC123051833 [Triticum aestivum]